MASLGGSVRNSRLAYRLRSVTRAHDHKRRVAGPPTPSVWASQLLALQGRQVPNSSRQLFSSLLFSAPLVRQRQEPIALVLAGGQSTRLGTDKRALELHFQDRTIHLLEWTIERVGRLDLELMVSLGAIHGHNLDSWVEKNASLRVITDDVDLVGSGPIAGILSASRTVAQSPLLVVACDLPLVSVRLLRELLDCWRSSTCDIACVKGKNHWEPLLAVYGARSFHQMAERIASGRRSLYPLMDARELDVEACTPTSLDLRKELLNVNRTVDLEAAARHAGSTTTRSLLD